VHITTWRIRPWRSDRIGGFKGSIEKPVRSCNDLGLWVQVGVLRAMRLARGRDEEPIALAEDTQALAELPTAADFVSGVSPPGDRFNEQTPWVAKSHAFTEVWQVHDVTETLRV
jgi:hypothetical protein